MRVGRIVSVFLLLDFGWLLIACGSGTQTLTIVPASESITVNLLDGTATGATPLRALVNNNPLPAGSVLWDSNDALCVVVDQSGNPTCSAPYGSSGTQCNGAIASDWRNIIEAISATCKYQ